MRKSLFGIVAFMAMLVVLPSCNHNDIWGRLNDISDSLSRLDKRVTVLEELCKQQNTNITSLQTIVEAQQQGDYITSVVPIQKEGEIIGYTITFGKHDPITIYNGEDSTYVPVIGVKKDVDGRYYWTLDGEWLLDDGNKICAEGKDGEPGTPGTAGVTPQLKVDGDYWYVSYDKGVTWQKLSKAKGEDGEPGTPGTPGKDGDSMFKSVTYDENYVYFTLTDDTVIKLSRKDSGGGSVEIVNGAIQAAFSVKDGKKVYFSMGNLQYQASTNIWRFAEHQCDYIGENNKNISSTYSGWIDLFGWGTSGYNSKSPYMTSTVSTDYGNGENNIAGTNYDWGVYNAISNGGNSAGQWRTLTRDEWYYLLSTRSTDLRSLATVKGVCGLLVLPDNWETPEDVSYTATTSDYTTNVYDEMQWSLMESYGAVFLPAAGYRDGTSVRYAGSYGYYWSSSYNSTNFAYYCSFISGNLNPASNRDSRYYGRAVRLVQDVK